jgi:hypothetical protein
VTLVEQLRQAARTADPLAHSLHIMAANEIERLEVENKRLRRVEEDHQSLYDWSED